MKDMDYSYEYEDSGLYCYPHTNVLVNKYGVRDLDSLHFMEREYSMARYFELKRRGITGNFTLKHLQSIHKYLFQDTYEWAGQIRKENISKGTIFCLIQFIEMQFAELYRWLEKENFLVNVQDKEQMSFKLAYVLGELNMIHPFREGNGRTQRLYIEQLCMKNGRFEIDFSKISANEMLEASIESSKTLHSPKMQDLLMKCLRDL